LGIKFSIIHAHTQQITLEVNYSKILYNGKIIDLVWPLS
jgi:hypothetical protein